MSTSVLVFAKILIVNPVLSRHYGTGIYLTRIFSSWPKERLACAGRVTSAPDFSRCERFYQLGTSEFRPPPLIKNLFPIINSGPVSDEESANRNSETTRLTYTKNGGVAALRYLVRRTLAGGDLMYRIQVSPQLLEWIKQFQPEIIYGQCSTLSTAIFLRRIHDATGLPLVLHCMDDFAEGHYRAGWSRAVDGYLYRREFNKLMQRASVVIGICKEMASEYQARYQRSVTWVNMPADVPAYSAVRRTNWKQPKEFRIRYGGRIGWGIRSSIAEIALAVKELRQEGYHIIFDIVRTNSSDVREEPFQGDGVRMLQPEPVDEVPRALARADALVVCYDFDGQSYREARFSMPSKVAECMASGTPVLVYGPGGLPVVEYAREEGWAKVVDENNKSILKEAILELYNSQAMRETLGIRAMQLANERHNMATVSEEFHKIISEVMHGKLTKNVLVERGD